MRKTFVFNWKEKSPLKINFSYPDFKKEGISALFPLFDWVTYLIIISFAVLVFLVRSANVFDVVYASSIVLFSVQVMRTILGGFGYFPKTTLDVGGLFFIALAIIAILVSNTQDSSLFGEGKLFYLAGMSSFALLLISYFVVSQSVFRGSAGFVKKVMILVALVVGFKLIGDRAVLMTKEISAAYYLPLAIPFLFFTFLQSRKFIKQTLMALALFMALYAANFNDFSFTFSILVSLFITFLTILLGGSEFLYLSITSLGNGVGKIFKRKGSFWDLLKKSGQFLAGALGFFSIFIFTIVKSVENFSDNFAKTFKVFTDVWNGLNGIKEILFGKGLDTYSGSFYADILNSFGAIGLAGFIFLVVLSLIYLFKTLKKAYKEKNSKLLILLTGILTSYLSLLVYFKLESVTVYGFILLWLFLILIGAYSTVALYKHKTVLSVVGGTQNAKNKRKNMIVKIGGIFIVAIIGIISVYLILK